MEDILRELQKYQLDAFRKGVTYDLDMSQCPDSTMSFTVKMYHTTVSECIDHRTFSTTFSNDDRMANMKLGRIRKFIDNIEEEND